MTHARVAAAQQRVIEAEEALRVAKAERGEEFKIALVALCNEYQMCVQANGTEGARIEILPLHDHAVWTLKDLDREM